MVIGRWTSLYAVGLGVGLAGLSDLAFINPGGPLLAGLGIGLLVAPLSLTFIIRFCCWNIFEVHYFQIGKTGITGFLARFSLLYGDDPLFTEGAWWLWLQLLSAFAVRYGISTAIFSNWILAAIAADNWMGTPSSDSRYSSQRRLDVTADLFRCSFVLDIYHLQKIATVQLVVAVSRGLSLVVLLQCEHRYV